MKTPQANPIDMANIQSAITPSVIASIMIPIATPIGLEMANAKA